MTIVSFANYQSERVHDIWRSEYHPLDAIFSPKTIAIIGATERDGSVGRTVLWNLMSHPFGGTIFPVNPQRPSVLGIKAYPSIADVPEAVDLAIIATPALSVPDLVGECVDANVKGVIILSAGFREIGSVGVELEQRIRTHLQRGQLRLIGPNCLGVMNPHLGLNATFANSIAKPGKVGFISQSGALCSAILDWSFHENVGFSSFISIGSMLDVDWGDLIYYLGDDPHTESIVIYMESIGDPRSFLSAAREVALTKPIIVIKAGRTEAAAQAATSHTGAMAGSDDVFNAALRRCGVLRVESISDLFDMAEVLAKQPRPKGSRLTIITNAGGPGVLATDALVANGGTLAELSPETIDRLNQHLPTHWSHHNPIDILGDADPDRYAKALEIAAKDPNNDGLLVILTPQSMSDPTQTAQQLQHYSQLGKPILASWMGNLETSAGAELLNQAKIPTFAYPDTAARLFNYMWRYSYNLRGIYETPAVAEVEAINHVAIETIIQTARSAGRTLLSEFESKQILAAYSIPTVETYVAESADQAVQIAEKLTYPVVLKLYSETITHKTDVGGVQLNLRNADSVREAYHAIASTVAERTQDPNAFLGVTVQPMIQREGYELIIGSSLDPQFGPVMLFGSGGQLVEVYRDRAIALPPLNTTLARRMMEQTRIYQALQGVRGRKAIDLAALEQLLVRFSQLVVEQRWIKEIEINPLLASTNTLLALDARIVLHDPDVTEAELPKLAVRPYPSQFTWQHQLPNQKQVTIRPIRPEDEPLLIQFHKTLSEESVYFRYFHMIGLKQRIAHERLTRLCFIDYDRELALVAESKDPQTGESELLAVARLSKLHATNDAEFGMMVSDRYQYKGLGTTLLNCLLNVGRHEQLDRISAEILCENRAMQRVCEKLGFHLHRDAEEGVMKAEILLSN
ncbi:MAG: bifunctional acetate--CoA ligase family protein/GNAT family N-acetyltransferase [Leptolyngbya sp. Prado105]|jgi:acetyltransferase|nr:bifunctional acetate--CoA ligase family protein/GNAT family N-acetyltransferase [Leptolyngbya sp. Prado105]